MVSPELRKKFILDEAAATERTERLVVDLCEWCVLDPKGRVIIKRDDLPSRDRVKVVLSARWLAAELDSGISAEVSTVDLAASTGLPADQLRARLSEVVRSRFASATSKGVYVAAPRHVEVFVRELTERLANR